MPFNDEERTVISATVSPAEVCTFSSVISAPISFKTLIIPVLVGFIPTFVTVICEFGIIAPSTKKNAAEEISPGTSTLTAVRSFVGFTVISRLSTVKSAPIALNISSVWSRDFSIS